MFGELSQRGAVRQQDGEVIEPERSTAWHRLHSRFGMKSTATIAATPAAALSESFDALDYACEQSAVLMFP